MEVINLITAMMIPPTNLWVGILSLWQRLASYLQLSSCREMKMLKYHRYMQVRCLPAFLAIQKLYAARWREEDEAVYD